MNIIATSRFEKQWKFTVIGKRKAGRNRETEIKDY